MISVERAAKFARENGCKLNVFVEKSDPKTDKAVEGYFKALKQDGHPFDKQSASKYVPLEQPELRNILYDFKTKNKSSPMMQVADLYLYPMCRGGYQPDYRAYDALVSDSKLIDCHVADIATLGVKYYCFENVSTKKTGADGVSPSAPGQPSEEDLVG